MKKNKLTIAQRRRIKKSFPFKFPKEKKQQDILYQNLKSCQKLKREYFSSEVNNFINAVFSLKFINYEIAVIDNDTCKERITTYNSYLGMYSNTDHERNVNFLRGFIQDHKGEKLNAQLTSQFLINKFFNHEDYTIFQDKSNIKNYIINIFIGYSKIEFIDDYHFVITEIFNNAQDYLNSISPISLNEHLE